MSEYATSRHPSLHVDTSNSVRPGEPYATSTPALRITSRQPEPSWISAPAPVWTQSPTPSRAPSRPLPTPAPVYTQHPASDRGMSEYSRAMSHSSRGMSDFRQQTLASGSGMEPAPEYENAYRHQYGDEASGYGYDQEEGGGYDEGFGERDEYADDDVEVESDNEHMTVEPLGEAGMYDVPPGKAKGKARAFVGGFVAGFKRFPRVIPRNKLKRRVLEKKGGGADAGSEFATDGEALPRYDSPGQPVLDPSNVQYVEAMDMPHEQRASEVLSYVSPQSHPVSVGRRPSTQLSYADHRSSHTVSDNAPLDNPYDHEPPASLGTMAALASPVQMNPLPTQDYQKMDPPRRFHPQDDSFSAHINRVSRFLHTIRELPWTSSRVVDDYEPGKSRRARLAAHKPQGSWYSAHREHVPVDLLGTPGPMMGITPYAPSQISHSTGIGHVPVRSTSTGHTSPVYSPVAGSSGSRIALPRHTPLHGPSPLHPPPLRSPSPRTRSPDGARATRTGGHVPNSPDSQPISSPGASSQGQNQKSFSYNYYFAPPQPLYVYPSQNGSPQGSPTPTQANPPMYVMPGPPQIVIPAQPASPGGAVPPSPIVTPPSPGAPGAQGVPHVPTVTQFPRSSGSSQGHGSVRLTGP
ncbi:hypothetical protein CERSUDRAFT_112525 [Gelatoporia subvermispora B]|uniref:Uncharacterized protein n=1 Tax=Ceriporiopsis subvermispora (strain B) TaxID=914234 RepID=M2QNZ2_CERS8|nr:hypothetical protein CERSUDRAFT_112525 [Gelatoporia subvermispora B]